MKRTVDLQRPPLVAEPLASAKRSVLRPKGFHDRLESMSKADNGHVRATAIEIHTEGG